MDVALQRHIPGDATYAIEVTRHLLDPAPGPRDEGHARAESVEVSGPAFQLRPEIDIPIFGLPGAPRSDAPMRTLQAAASDLIRLIKQAQPTGPYRIAGWCFGGAFSPLFACDLAVAAETATFGVSEINWGIIPGGNVTKVLVELMSQRDAMYYTLTGETFDGKKAADSARLGVW